MPPLQNIWIRHRMYKQWCWKTVHLRFVQVTNTCSWEVVQWQIQKFWKGGGGGKKQLITSFLIYRKWAKRKKNTKKRLFEKKCKTTGGGRSHRPPWICNWSGVVIYVYMRPIRVAYSQMYDVTQYTVTNDTNCTQKHSTLNTEELCTENAWIGHDLHNFSK